MIAARSASLASKSVRAAAPQFSSRVAPSPRTLRCMATGSTPEGKLDKR